ncbi:MAG: hypothetical protein IT507_18420, partial [Burkholderiaceae bacterium]|nr:hypothetical protein [Burkholderiaceae bacterium]
MRQAATEAAIPAVDTFGVDGGAEPANIDALNALLREDPYDLELLISFGTSKGGSAGHIALAVRGEIPGDDLVYSANFYADRARKHESGRYTRDLMVAIPKTEYLFRTSSSIATTAAFGLDYGEIYKRSVIGVRVYGVPREARQSLIAYFQRINADYHRQARNTEYHDGDVKYDYMRLNCAKTIGSAFRYGAGYSDLDVANPTILTGRRLVAAATANLPTEMAMKLISAWNKRGYGMDVVLYKKYRGSTYIDPHEAEKVAFKDLPNRFPSVRSWDFRRDEGAYEDFDNLYAMYLLYNLGKYSVRIDPQTRLLVIEKDKRPMDFAEADTLARESARKDSESFSKHTMFRPLGIPVGEPADNTHL